MGNWDTACLVKLYAPEADSAIFRQRAAGLSRPPVTGCFTRLELWTALRRKESETALAPGEAAQLLAAFDEDALLGSVKITALSQPIEAEFEQLVDTCLSQSPPTFIRTLDALHLATARSAGETEVVSTDRRLREAAALLGFSLFLQMTP